MLAVCAALGTVAFAQDGPEVKLPASPAGQSAVQLGGRWETDAKGEPRYAGGKWLVVDYGRPILRGRKDIFGSGADYGKVVNGNAAIWRAGANDTTRLTTQAPLVIGGKTIQPGVYNVFVDLKPNAWTLVLTTQPVQEKYDPNDKVRLYGAYNYDGSFDVVRAPMRVSTLDHSIEQFTIGFADLTDAGVTLTMAWEKTMASIELTLAR
jgi:hypothetical protein